MASLVPPSEGSTRGSLLEAIRAGSPEGWSRFVDLYGPLVFAWGRRRGLPSESAADVMQETFLAASRSIGTFAYRGSSDSFRGWLYGIFRHKLAEYHRRREEVLSAVGGSAMQQRLALAVDELAAGDEPDVREEDRSDAPQDLRALAGRAAEMARAEFEPQTWQAFWQTAVDGRAAPDVAEELAMTPAAVRKAKSRVLRRLRELLGE